MTYIRVLNQKIESYNSLSLIFRELSIRSLLVTRISFRGVLLIRLKNLVYYLAFKYQTKSLLRNKLIILLSIKEEKELVVNIIEIV